MKKFLTLLLAAALLVSPAAAITFTASATGTTASQVIYEGQAAQARIMEVSAEGTFGGTSIVIQRAARGTSTYLDVATITAAGIDYVYLVPGDSVRLVLTGGTGISVTIRIR